LTQVPLETKDWTFINGVPQRTPVAAELSAINVSLSTPTANLVKTDELCAIKTSPLV
jgi:hypothetical protein